MDVRELISGDPDFEGFDVLEGDVPAYDPDTADECLKLCSQNLCGSYGTNWGCPPGHTAHMDSLAGRFDRTIVLKKTFMTDPKDSEKVKGFGKEMQDAVRLAVISLRSSGIDCAGFADGGCSYCGVCAYPEPCRFPEMLIPSVSALGIDLGGYLATLGEGFSFRDDRLTLYGLILYRRLLTVSRVLSISLRAYPLRV